MLNVDCFEWDSSCHIMMLSLTVIDVYEFEFLCGQYFDGLSFNVHQVQCVYSL